VSWLTRAKLALALIGVILFGYGVRAEDERLRWMGIGFLAASAILRWWRRGPRTPA
jgi:hypothetical protein